MASPDYDDVKLPPIIKLGTQNKSYVERHLSGITGHQQTLQVIERQTEASGYLGQGSHLDWKKLDTGLHSHKASAIYGPRIRRRPQKRHRNEHAQYPYSQTALSTRATSLQLPDLGGQGGPFGQPVILKTIQSLQPTIPTSNLMTKHVAEQPMAIGHQPGSSRTTQSVQPGIPQSDIVPNYSAGNQLANRRKPVVRPVIEKEYLLRQDEIGTIVPPKFRMICSGRLQIEKHHRDCRLKRSREWRQGPRGVLCTRCWSAYSTLMKDS